MNTEPWLGDFRLSINIYSPNYLGCQEAKQNFFPVLLLYQQVRILGRQLLNYLWYRANAKRQKGNGQWKSLQGKWVATRGLRVADC